MQLWKKIAGKNPKLAREILTTIIMLVAIFAFRSTVAEPFVVPTGSMEPTIRPGDRLLVLNAAYDLRFPFTDFSLAHLNKPKRGDIIVFKFPLDTSVYYVKRLIGLPGDEIEVTDGFVKINGAPFQDQRMDPKEVQPLYYDGKLEKVIFREQHESATYFIQRLGLDPEAMPQKFTVPQGQYFFMGDNRDNSNDSRFWGFVPEGYLKGKALAVWFSAVMQDNWVPDIRWDRIGNKLTSN